MPINNSHHLFHFTKDEGYIKRQGAFIGNNDAGDLRNFFDVGNQAPDITPFGFMFSRPDISDVNAINVVHDFEWTHTPGHGRHEVPYVRLSEYRVNFNSLLQNIRYLLAGNSAKEMFGKIGSTIGGIVPGALAEQLAKKGGESAGGVVDHVAESIGLGPIQNPKNVADYLKPYYGLYGASPTGFEYYMPYFEEDFKTVNTSWNNFADGGGPLKALYADVFSKEGFLRTLTSGALLSKNALGASVERPKQYNYGDEGPSINIRFDLINTERQTDIIKNWQLVFMLLYQNLPNRTSKLLVEPPVIYEAEVPGKFYSPYAYISSLKVTNLGATRMMTVPYKIHNKSKIVFGSKEAHAQRAQFNNQTEGRDVNGLQTQSFVQPNSYRDDTVHVSKDTITGELPPGAVLAEPVGDGKSPASDTGLVSTVIPDAYRIEITLTSLIPESKNFLFHSLLRDKTLTAGVYGNSTTPDMRVDRAVGNPNQSGVNGPMALQNGNQMPLQNGVMQPTQPWGGPGFEPTHPDDRTNRLNTGYYDLRGARIILRQPIVRE